jgi:hypothetical protein
MLGEGNLALVGAACYIAPRLMKATNRLVPALDPSDSVSIIPSHFPYRNFLVGWRKQIGARATHVCTLGRRYDLCVGRVV